MPSLGVIPGETRGTVLQDAENHMTVPSFVWTHYRARMMDRRTVRNGLATACTNKLLLSSLSSSSTALLYFPLFFVMINNNNRTCITLKKSALYKTVRCDISVWQSHFAHKRHIAGHFQELAT